MADFAILIQMPAPHATFLLAPPKAQADSSEHWAHILAGLPLLKNHWYDRLLSRHETCSLELVWNHGWLGFYLTVPQRLASLTANLIAGWLPEALLELQTNDPLSVFLERNPAASSTIMQVLHPSWRASWGIQTAFTTDALMGLYAGMARIPYEDATAIQVVLAPYLVRTPASDSDGAVPSPAQMSRTFVTTWKIATQSHTPAAATERIRALCGTLDVFAAQDSHLFSPLPSWWPENTLTHLLRRAPSWWFRQSFLIDQTALLMHPPGEHMATIPNIAWGKHLAGEPPAHLPVVRQHMDAPQRREINPFATTVYKNRRVVYGLRRTDRRRHLYVIGKTGTGKSTLLANMAINDLKHGEGLCVIDPHGDLVETLLDYIPSRRINDVIYIDPSDSQSTVRLNLFEGENVVHRELIASAIISVFRKLYGYSWGPRLEHILRNALLTLLKTENARLSDIADLLTNPDFRRQIVGKLDDPILKNFWVNEFDRMQERLRTEAIAPVLNKVGQFVTSPLVRDVVNTRKSSVSIEQAMNAGKIVLVNLSQGKLGEDNATLLGAMLITKIQLAAMARVHQPEEQRRDFYLYVDEFQNFATESFSKILSEARKYRLNLILANQYIAQIPVDVQKAIFGNCGSVIAFVMGAEDAKLFSSEFSNQYAAEELVGLQRHQIINRMSIDNIISEAFPATSLPLARSSNQNRAKVIQVSKERYARKRESTRMAPSSA